MTEITRRRARCATPNGWLSRTRLAGLALVGFASLALLASPASAVTMSEWDIASSTGQTAAVLNTAANVSASVLDNSGVTQWPQTNYTGLTVARGWATGLTLDPTRYFEFSVTAGSGYSVTYNTISLALIRGVAGGTHGAQLWDLQASTDAFASSIDLGTLDISGSGSDVQTNFVDYDISGVGTQSGTVTFRLYGYDHTRANDYAGFGNNTSGLLGGTGRNLVIDGVVVATPQPATGLLVLLGLAGIASLRRAQRPRPSLLDARL